MRTLLLASLLAAFVGAGFLFWPSCLMSQRSESIDQKR